MGANQAAKERQAQSYSEPQTKATEVVQPAKIKKKVIREYDAEGNVISEKEVKK